MLRQQRVLQRFKTFEGHARQQRALCGRGPATTCADRVRELTPERVLLLQPATAFGQMPLYI